MRGPSEGVARARLENPGDYRALTTRRIAVLLSACRTKQHTKPNRLLFPLTISCKKVKEHDRVL